MRLRAILATLVVFVVAGCGNERPGCTDPKVLNEVRSLVLNSQALTRDNTFFLGSFRKRKEIDIPPLALLTVGPAVKLVLNNLAASVGDDAVLLSGETLRKLVRIEFRSPRPVSMEAHLDILQCAVEAQVSAEFALDGQTDTHGRKIEPEVWWNTKVPTKDILALHLSWANSRVSLNYLIQKLESGELYIEVRRAPQVEAIIDR